MSQSNATVDVDGVRELMKCPHVQQMGDIGIDWETDSSAQTAREKGKLWKCNTEIYGVHKHQSLEHNSAFSNGMCFLSTM